jgi:hypothetical protein
MNTLKSWRFWVMNVTIAVVAFANMFVLSHSLPFMGHNKTFGINRIIEHSQWVEGAPVVLTNHFSTVSVNHIGDRFKNGFGFESELIGIFKVHSVDRSQDPIDIRGKVPLKTLLHYRRYETTTHCSGQSSKYCNLWIVWDGGNSAPYRTFIGVQVDDSLLLSDFDQPNRVPRKVKTFMLLDSNLYRNLIGDPNAN